jgi:hypothetical protein
VFSRPTTEQLLAGIAEQLRTVVASEVQTEPTKILLQQIDQVLMSCSRRAAHEIAWIYEEADRIAAETGRTVGHPDSLHLDDMVEWYNAASAVLSEELEAAFRTHDESRIAKLKAVLDARSAVEMQILGALDLVGRG